SPPRLPPPPPPTLFPYTTLFRSPIPPMVHSRSLPIRPLGSGQGLRRRLQRTCIDRQGAHTLAGGGEDRIGDCGTDNGRRSFTNRSEEHTSELQSLRHLVCRLLLE